MGAPSGIIVHWGYNGIIENKMETTIMGSMGFEV